MKRTVTCGVCGGEGHNKRTCLKRLDLIPLNLIPDEEPMEEDFVLTPTPREEGLVADWKNLPLDTIAIVMTFYDEFQKDYWIAQTARFQKCLRYGSERRNRKAMCSWMSVFQKRPEGHNHIGQHLPMDFMSDPNPMRSVLDHGNFCTPIVVVKKVPTKARTPSQKGKKQCGSCGGWDHCSGSKCPLDRSNLFLTKGGWRHHAIGKAQTRRKYRFEKERDQFEATRGYEEWKAQQAIAQGHPDIYIAEGDVCETRGGETFRAWCERRGVRHLADDEVEHLARGVRNDGFW